MYLDIEKTHLDIEITNVAQVTISITIMTIDYVLLIRKTKKN
jgi:hypothetical protein